MRDPLTKGILQVLVRVAPEIDAGTVPDDVVLRDAYDLDSMDFLNFMIGLHDAFGIEVPEADYPRLATLGGCVQYLRDHGVGTAPRKETGMPSHTFEASLRWEHGAQGIATSNHVVTFANGTPLEVSGAPQYRGDPTRLNPEELFLTSVASCQLLTYLALAGRAGVTVLRYEDSPVGTLAIADRKMRMTEVHLRPRITIAPTSDATKARSLVQAAHDSCFIANSVTAAVRIEPEIALGTAV